MLKDLKREAYISMMALPSQANHFLKKNQLL